MAKTDAKSAEGIDFTGMTIEQITAMKEQADEALVERIVKRQNELREEYRALLDRIGEEVGKYNVTANEFLGLTRPELRKYVLASIRGEPLKGSKAVVRYRDPEDSSRTWAGRGQRPKWLRDKLESGHSLEEFRVTNPSAGQGSA